MLRRPAGTFGGFCVETADTSGIFYLVLGGSGQVSSFAVHFQGKEVDAAAVIL